MTTDVKRLSQLAEVILKDPVLMRQLSDRIYDLMQTDMHQHCDRNGGRWRTR